MYRKSLLVLVVVSTLVLGISMTGIEVHAQSLKMEISDDAYWGCTDIGYYHKLITYVLQGDSKAFDKAFEAMLRAGVCTDFKKGEEVFLTGKTSSSGPFELERLRRVGELKEYWALKGAAK